MDDVFDWGSENPEVIVPSTGAIAVYVGKNGHVVVRQEASMMGDEDMFVAIPPDSIAKVIEAMIRARDAAKAAERESG